ncbi:MAG: CPBP family intramembrane metalloprotease [Euryarchaeota archaeon]|nr:CPBP family intramembrane metalloprotease [Euryarchaeota archaeon]
MAIGIIMSVVMFVTWYIFRGFLPTESIREFVEPFGLLNRWLYLAVFIYWVTFNSLLEEYLFRWFIFEKASSLTNDFAAVFISSLAFTSHHVFGVSKMLPDWGAILASLGVFTGGFVWSLLYKKHRSIWPCYISHVIVDITLFGIAAFILFG